MSLAAKLPFRHRHAAGFPGLGSQPVPTDADALDYLDRMAAADGASVEVGVATAVSAFVADSKALGVWDSIRSSCVLAGARTLAGALVPLKNEGPELVDINSLPTPTILNDGTPTAGAWDAETRTISNTAVGVNGYPRLLFNFGLTAGKTYKVSGVLSGDTGEVFVVRLGSPYGVLEYDSSTGVISGSVAAANDSLYIYLVGTLAPTSVTIESLSIREVIASPTNVADGFVEGDFSRTAGLTGDGATTHLDSGRAGNADPRNDAHAAVYGTTLTQSTNWLGGEGASTKNVALSWYSPYFYHNRNMTNPGNQRTSTSFVSSGFAGVSRSGSTSTSARYGGTTYIDSSASSEPSSDNSFVFAYNDAGVTSDFSDSTLAFYSIGTSLSLENLDAAVSNLLTRLKFALLVGENPSGLDPDAIDYIVRGYEAGGTLE